MALGKRAGEQQDLWVASQDIPKSPGHPFYEQLNRLLGRCGFDRFVEGLCAPYYAEGGRPSIPPGVYFRMLMVGYFEGIGSQRGIAWRCSDSLSLKEFLGLSLTEKAPDHSSLTKIRKRLPLSVHEEVFRFVLETAAKKGLLRGKTLLVDATTLEANAAMKSIVRKASGEDWKAYVNRLAKEAGIEDPTDEDLRRFDRKREDKKVSNQEWESKTDPESRIAKMKDGRTHLAYKAEHAVDAESNLVVAAEIYGADEADSATILETLEESQMNLVTSEGAVEIEAVVADKGYHKAETVAELERMEWTPYIAEPRRKKRYAWWKRPLVQQRAVYANRRRLKTKRGRKLQRLRSELPERSFAHFCRTGGARRTWLRGRTETAKRYLLTAASHNLGVILRHLIGCGTARSLQGAPEGILESLLGFIRLILTCLAGRCSSRRTQRQYLNLVDV